jgi:hypothetical protein
LVFVSTALLCTVALIVWRLYQTSDVIPELN